MSIVPCDSLEPAQGAGGAGAGGVGGWHRDGGAAAPGGGGGGRGGGGGDAAGGGGPPQQHEEFPRVGPRGRGPPARRLTRLDDERTDHTRVDEHGEYGGRRHGPGRERQAEPGEGRSVGGGGVHGV